MLERCKGNTVFVLEHHDMKTCRNGDKDLHICNLMHHEIHTVVVLLLGKSLWYPLIGKLGGSESQSGEKSPASVGNQTKFVQLEVTNSCTSCKFEICFRFGNTPS
jgi:hypothetical protein